MYDDVQLPQCHEVQAGWNQIGISVYIHAIGYLAGWIQSALRAAGGFVWHNPSTDPACQFQQNFLKG